MDFNQRIAAYLAGKKPVLFDSITFDDGPAVALDLSDPVFLDKQNTPYYAILVVEADSTSETSFCAHFREDPLAPAAPPTATVGMPLANGVPYELQGFDQIKNFRIIGTEAGKTHRLQITYYKLGDQ